MIISSYPTLYMSLWLKAEGYSVTQTNNLPTIVYAVNIIASWLGTTLAAIYPSWIIYTFASVCCLFSTLCMIVWNIPTALKFVSPWPQTTHILMKLLGSPHGISSDFLGVRVRSYIRQWTPLWKMTRKSEPSSWYVYFGRNPYYTTCIRMLNRAL